MVGLSAQPVSEELKDLGDFDGVDDFNAHVRQRQRRFSLGRSGGAPASPSPIPHQPTGLNSSVRNMTMAGRPQLQSSPDKAGR